MSRAAKGALVEYTLSIPPLALQFEFNPEQISRTRTITVKTGNSAGTRGGYDFLSPFEAARAAQGVSIQPETFSIDILLDATDRMDRGDTVASMFGVQPELDVLRSMVEPKAQGPAGVQTLASLGAGMARAFQRNESASVLLFIWARSVLPVFLTSVKIDEKAHLPSLLPYRANASLSMQVIEGRNPFYLIEKARQTIGAALAGGAQVAEILRGLG
jgi:hypothetical protein